MNQQQFEGFTGNIEGITDDGLPYGGGTTTSQNSDIYEFYQLPLLTKQDQVDIITELTKGMEINMTPKVLVECLNQHIISQPKAKRIISQAIRNKYRMRQIEDKELRKAMRPSNILVSGRSGSGKTEIFRQISRIYNAPFIRVEATKYTEVGYHGEDVSNIITDLFKKTQNEILSREAVELFENSTRLKQIINSHILKLLLGPSYKECSDFSEKEKQLESGELDEWYCYLFVPHMHNHNGDYKSKSSSKDKSSPKMNFEQLKIKEIRNYMYEVYAEELFKIIDIEELVKTEVENKAIVVIDEIDKLVRGQENSSGTKASDEGVQYDLLPILDGTIVNINTKMKLSTRNILFVAAGAFEKVKPTELAIELQGRLPVNAKMESLTKDDFIKILCETKHNLLLQAVELLKTEDVNIVFKREAIFEMAEISV